MSQELSRMTLKRHELLQELQECVAEHFPVSIEHATFQIEPQSHPGEHTTHA